MTNQVLDPQVERTPRPQPPVPNLLRPEGPSLISSLVGNVRDVLFPEKLPPLKLTSKPVPVRDIWEKRDPKKIATASLGIHALMVLAMVLATILGARVVKQVQNHETVTLIAPDMTQFLPMSPKPKVMGGGGGGGDVSKIQAPKGKLPKVDTQQITPPAIVVRNEQPKLPVEATVVAPPSVKLPNSNMPTIGNPLTSVVGPASNGTGSSGGIGAGGHGGVGIGTGAGVGPGSGGGFGGGPLRVGGGVKAPTPLETPDPEYSEEARKAKYQGVVVLWLVVGPDGHPKNIKVERPLGMGLDQKAVEAVQRWRFEPATKDGKPVAVQINVEVNFRLY
ncbi:MAG: TonB-like protein [Acidobacteriales bacterium]|nr:TonB-like protein [Terriglobales bacterium]